MIHLYLLYLGDLDRLQAKNFFCTLRYGVNTAVSTIAVEMKTFHAANEYWIPSS